MIRILTIDCYLLNDTVYDIKSDFYKTILYL